MIKFFILAMVLTVTNAQMLPGLSAMLGPLTKLGGGTHASSSQPQLPTGLKGYGAFGGKPGPSSSQSGPSSSLGFGGAGGLTGIMGMMGGGPSAGGFGLQGLFRMRIARKLCNEAEATRLPCKGSHAVCNLASIRKFGFPGLLQCSPAGIGCCFKNVHMMRIFNK